MASTQPPKLTKKQKKGIAFRERKQGKSNKSKNDQPDGEDDSHAIPIQEAVDQAERQDGDVEMEKDRSAKTSKEGTGKTNGKSKGKHKAEDFPVRGDTKVVDKAKKRKREEGEAHETEKPKQKKMKTDDTKVEVGGKDAKSEVKQRFILFVGASPGYTFMHGTNMTSQATSNIPQARKQSRNTSQHVV